MVAPRHMVFPRPSTFGGGIYDICAKTWSNIGGAIITAAVVTVVDTLVEFIATNSQLDWLKMN